MATKRTKVERRRRQYTAEEKSRVGERASRILQAQRGPDAVRPFKAGRLPLGSGAVESAVRMIVNLRLKSTGQFWLRENAQSMLMLRSYLKSGRFDDLVDWSNAQAAAWWPDGIAAAPARPVAGPRS